MASPAPGAVRFGWMDDGGWVEVATLDDVPVGRPVKVTVGDQDVLLYRTGEGIMAAQDHCTHQGAPLHKGSVRVSGSMTVVTCPLHGSQFQLSDGRVLRGPAMRRLPIHEARVSGEAVEVRLAATPEGR
jgi:nitrite reductase/ring-hydroxylating ferredoxin subunit